MKVDVINSKGEKVDSYELPEAIFEAPVNTQLLHQAYVRQLANARAGTHSTKGRSEVAGGGRKPWRQKGTGRARQGSIRAAQWVGGGKVFTPKPRDYSKKMPRKMRRAALRAALSLKASEEKIVLVDEITLPEAKTKQMVEILGNVAGNDSALVLLPEKNDEYERIVRSTRNLPDAKAMLANYLNIRDVLGYETVVLPVKSVDVLLSFLG